jgi:gamma-glutamyltranspeptidase/glutathione hydrolase
VELCPASRLTLVLLLLLRGQADVAVAMAAAINMMEPCMTGIGGDCFCLLFDAETG